MTTYGWIGSKPNENSEEPPVRSPHDTGLKHLAIMRAIYEVVDRLRAEYLEMPGLRLTADQVQRLCGIEQLICQPVLDALVAAMFLSMKSDGTYARVTDGEARSRPRTATADLAVEKSFLKAS